MSNPLDTNSYKFYLNFVNSFGTIEITEPVKFDGCTIVLEQDNERYGRDVSFMNESLDLFFYKGSYDTTENPLMMPNGTIYYNLTQGFEQLLEEYNINGFESEIELIIEKDNIQFITGVLDFKNAETDQLTYISCKVVNNTSKQIIKRREDFVVDMFSDENVDGNYIEPLQTTDILLKAKPINQQSEWKLLDNYAHLNEVLSDRAYIAPFTNIIKSNIEDTITPFNRLFGISSGQSDEYFWGKMYDTGFLIAKNDLTNIVLTFKNVKGSFYLPPNNSSIEDGWFSSLYYKRMVVNLFTTINGGSYDGTSPITYRKFTNELDFEFIGIENVDQFDLDPFYGNAYRYDFTIDEISFELNGISRDTRLSIALQFQRNFCIINWISGEMSIESTSTSIDTVIKGARWIDIIKQNVKSISGLEVYAPKLDNGGEFYDNFVFTGNLIKRRDDVAFPVKFKEITNEITEHNGDYQILNDKVYFNTYDKFYSNYEIGVFVTPPNDTAKSYFNDRYTINQFEFGYKTYEQDKDESNTIDAVHTQSQWSLDNRQVENIKKVELDHIRDAFKIEFARKQAINETTSTSDDDQLFIIDVVPLAPNSVGGFTAGLTHNINGDGNLQLLSQEGIPFNLLGFSVGDSFTILNTSNAGTYTVVEIEINLLTLSGSPSNNSGGLPILTEVEYFYTNVAYTNRTNEGFDLIENVLNPDKFSNLLYTIKRNMNHWLSYLKTASKYKPNGTLRNRYFRNNGELETQYTGETSVTIEDEDILNTNLTDALLEPNMYETTLIVPYSNMIDTFNLVNNINEDESIGGFIRVVNNNNRVLKLYPTKMEYNPATETMQLTGEQRYESEILTITTESEIIYIQEVGYDINTGYEWFEIDNGYLQLFDNNNLPIINPIRYDFVTVNGEYSESQEELSNKLIEIN